MMQVEPTMESFRKEDQAIRQEVLAKEEIKRLNSLNREYSNAFSGCTILHSLPPGYEKVAELTHLIEKQSQEFIDLANTIIKDYTLLKNCFTFIHGQLQGREDEEVVAKAEKVLRVVTGRIWSVETRINSYIGQTVDHRNPQVSVQEPAKREENLNSHKVHNSFKKIIEKVKELFSDKLVEIGVSLTQYKEEEKVEKAPFLDEMKEHLNVLKEKTAENLTDSERKDLATKQKAFRAKILDFQSYLMSFNRLVPYLVEAEKFLKPSYFPEKLEIPLDIINVEIMLDFHSAENSRKAYHEQIEHDCKVFPEQVRLLEKLLGEADLLYKDIRQLTEELLGQVGWVQSFTRPLNNHFGRSISKVEDPENPVKPYPLPFLSTQVPDSTEGMTHLEIVRKLVEITSEEWGFKSVVEMKNSEEAQDLSNENREPNDGSPIEVTGL